MFPTVMSYIGMFYVGATVVLTVLGFLLVKYGKKEQTQADVDQHFDGIVHDLAEDPEFKPNILGYED